MLPYDLMYVIILFVVLIGVAAFLLIDSAVDSGRKARSRHDDNETQRNPDDIQNSVPCPYCGNRLFHHPNFCPYCGHDLTIHYRIDQIEAERKKTEATKDSASIGYFFLGLLFPFIGIIVYLVIKGDKPKSAKMVMSGFSLLVLLVLLSIPILFTFGSIVFSSI